MSAQAFHVVVGWKGMEYAVKSAELRGHRTGGGAG